MNKTKVGLNFSEKSNFYVKNSKNQDTSQDSKYKIKNLKKNSLSPLF